MRFLKISKPRINFRLLAMCCFLKFLDFVKLWGWGGHLKVATLLKHFCNKFFWNTNNTLGSKWNFLTFLVLSTFILSLAFWWVLSAKLLFCPVRVLFWLAATAHGQRILNWKCFYRVDTFKWLPHPQILTKSKNFKNHHIAKSLKFILGFEIFEKSHF